MAPPMVTIEPEVGGVASFKKSIKKSSVCAEMASELRLAVRCRGASRPA
ncbi:Protein of unknown function, partial [Gryllus bimaculatus]